MGTMEKQKAAEQLIDEFAAQLLAFNDGKAIPRQWKNRLLKAIKPLPAKRGVKRDYGQVSEIVKRLALAGDMSRKSRTKHHNPADITDAIARDLCVSRKTVERIDDRRPANKIESMDDQEEFRAYINGLSAAVREELRKDEEIERKYQDQEMRRRFPRLFPPKK